MTSTEVATREIDGIETPQPGTYKVDPSHTSVEFVARHMMVTKVRGRFVEFDGTVHIAERLEDSWAEGTLKAGSIVSNWEQRDNHLRSADFLDADRFPDITFKSKRLESAGKNRWKAIGDLTIRNVTREIELDVEYGGMATSLYDTQVAFFTAHGELDREDFGMTWNQNIERGGVLVSKKVKLEIEAQVVRQDQ